MRAVSKVLNVLLMIILATFPVHHGFHMAELESLLSHAPRIIIFFILTAKLIC